MSWRRLKVLVTHLPRESRLAQVLDPRKAWSATDYLLASTVDALRGANWQRGGAKGKRPKPLPRPGAKPQSKRIGSASMPIDEWDRAYAARFPERGVRHGRRTGSGVRVDHSVSEGNREDAQS